MENVIGKIANIEKRHTISWLVMAQCMLLLSGCGHYAIIDRWQSKLTGDINKQQKISAQDLRKILINHFGITRVVLTDETYVLPDNGKVSDIQSDQFAYCNGYAHALLRPIGWDCDDYAAAAVVPMRNYAFGTMFVTTTRGTKHALNVFVNRKHEVLYWEPQRCQYYYDQFYAPPDMIIF
jgi:hypothetical protein